MASSIGKAQSLKEAQFYLDHSNYKVAISKFQKIKRKTIKENNIYTIVLATNGIANCYTDLGAYYKSNVLLFENLKLLNTSKNNDYKLNAETHLLITHNYDNQFFFDEYLKHCHQYFNCINKVFPKK